MPDLSVRHHPLLLTGSRARCTRRIVKLIRGPKGNTGSQGRSHHGRHTPQQNRSPNCHFPPSPFSTAISHKTPSRSTFRGTDLRAGGHGCEANGAVLSLPNEPHELRRSDESAWVHRNTGRHNRETVLSTVLRPSHQDFTERDFSMVSRFFCILFDRRIHPVRVTVSYL